MWYNHHEQRIKSLPGVQIDFVSLVFVVGYSCLYMLMNNTWKLVSCRKCAAVWVHSPSDLETDPCSQHIVGELLPTQVCRALGWSQVWRWKAGKSPSSGFSFDTPYQQTKCNNWRNWDPWKIDCLSWSFCHWKLLWSWWALRNVSGKNWGPDGKHLLTHTDYLCNQW